MRKKPHKECLKSLLPVRDSLEIIGGKWKILIMISLWEGNKHFSEIERSLETISAKVLSKELKEMEANKLLTRTVIDDYPVRIEYTPTEYSNSLKEIIAHLREWGENHRKHVFKR